VSKNKQTNKQTNKQNKTKRKIKFNQIFKNKNKITHHSNDEISGH
jgi:hypothetical protein